MRLKYLGKKSEQFYETGCLKEGEKKKTRDPGILFFVHREFRIWHAQYGFFFMSPLDKRLLIEMKLIHSSKQKKTQASMHDLEKAVDIFSDVTSFHGKI